VKFAWFLMLSLFFSVFRFPYFVHDAFMHHTMHVLDASDDGNQLGFLRHRVALPLLSFLITGPPRTPVLKVTNFRSSFGKLPKIPVLELVANKIGDIVAIGLLS